MSDSASAIAGTAHVCPSPEMSSVMLPPDTKKAPGQFWPRAPKKAARSFTSQPTRAYQTLSSRPGAKGRARSWSLLRERQRNRFGGNATVAVGVEPVEAEVGQVEPIAAARGCQVGRDL